MDDPENIRERKPRKTLVILTSVLVLLIFVLIGPSLIKEYGKFEKFSTASLTNISTASVDVGEVPPSASGTALNGGSSITLLEGVTKSVAVTGTVTDYNGCAALTSVIVAVYNTATRDSGTCAAPGDANNNDCYVWSDPDVSSSCGGTPPITYTLSHNFSMQYYATPGTWKATVTPSDGIGGTPDTTATGVTLNTLQALEVSASISYGSVSPGSSSDLTSPPPEATVTNTGNIAIDFNLAGVDLTCTTLGSIPVGDQEYDATGTFSYQTTPTPPVVALSGSATLVSVDMLAPTPGTVPVQQNTYWQVYVPYGTSGTCSGNVTFTAVAH